MDTAAIEALLAQITSAQAGDGAGAGASPDALSSAILARLNAEVAKYAADDGGAHAHAHADAAASSRHREGSSPSHSHVGSVGPRRPAPVELWRAAHESGKSAKPVRHCAALIATPQR